jgi:hypothetical protein
MAPLSAAELRDFADAVDKVAGAHWPRARAAGEDPDFSVLQALWTTAARQGWTELAAEESLDAVVAALSRLGRIACPLPLMDVYVAVRLLPRESPVVADIVAGAIRPAERTGSWRPPSRWNSPVRPPSTLSSGHSTRLRRSVISKNTTRPGCSSGSTPT